MPDDVLPGEPGKTTVHVPSTGQATVHGLATVDMEPGASVIVAGWYRSFEKYGFAGLVAFLFGWMIFNQFTMYGKLMEQRERDNEMHHQEVKELGQIYRDELKGMRDRYDDVRKEFRQNHLDIVKSLYEIKQELVLVRKGNHK